MWSRLKRRLRRRAPTDLDLAALDRLGELVGRIVALLPEDEPGHDAPPGQDAGPAEGAVAAPPEQPAVGAALLFVPSPSGYRLAEAGLGGVAPGDRVVLAEGRFRVLRLGPSPLPDDRRRCAFLEREEPSGAERTSDA